MRLLTYAIAVMAFTAFSPCLMAADEDDALLDSLKKEEKAAADANSIDTIAIEDFVKSRAPFKNRPKPDGLLFSDDAVKKYIASLPEKYRKRESDRYDNVKQVKSYLVRLFERNPYDRGGLLVKGKGKNAKPIHRNLMVTMANDKYLVTKAAPNAKPNRCFWADLDIGQYGEFFEYFIKKRIGVCAGDVVVKDTKVHAANDYLLLSLLYDWYGDYEKTLSYAKQAIESSPEIKKQANALLLVPVE